MDSEAVGKKSSILVAGNDRRGVLDSERSSVNGKTLPQRVEILFPAGAAFPVECRKSGKPADAKFVPDILRLPKIEIEGQLRERAGKAQSALECLLRWSCHQINHGAFHALVGGIGDRCSVKRNLVGLGTREKGFQQRLINRVRLDGALESGIHGESGSNGKRGRLRQAALREKMQ